MMQDIPMHKLHEERLLNVWYMKNIKKNLIFTAFAILLMAGLAACSGSGKKSSEDSAALADYHADNDIAMTIRSVMDAISVDQQLDSAEYNFKGTLTDGTGRPLYTDIQGTPGAWEVKVANPGSVTIRNLYLGDLLPEELTQYILQSLSISDSTLVAAGIAGNDPDAEVQIYDAGKCELIFETKMALTEDGEKGPLLNIAVRKKAS